MGEGSWFGPKWDASEGRFSTSTLSNSVNFRIQHGASRRKRAPAVLSSPLWARWLVLAFTLAFGAITTGQAAHLHRPGTAAHQVQPAASGSQSSDSEEHCPLCVAMHQQALPAPIHIEPSTVLTSVPAVELEPEHVTILGWHFARLSRPPPFLQLT